MDKEVKKDLRAIIFFTVIAIILVAIMTPIVYRVLHPLVIT